MPTVKSVPPDTWVTIGSWYSFPIVPKELFWKVSTKRTAAARQALRTSWRRADREGGVGGSQGDVGPCPARMGRQVIAIYRPP